MPARSSLIYDHFRSIPLTLVMVLTFVLQAVAIVGLVNYLSDGYWEIWIYGLILMLSIGFGLIVSYWISRTYESVEIALKESQEKYKVLFQTLPIGVSITDKEARILESNAISEKWLGIPNPSEIGCLQQRKINPNVLRPDGSPMPVEEYPCVRALKSSQSVDDVEIGIVCEDETLRWFSVSASPIPLEQYGVVLVHVNISDRKFAEQAMRRSELKLQAFLDNAPTLIAIKDLEGKYLSVNQEFVYFMQVSEAEILGKYDYNFFSAETVKNIRRYELQAIFEGLAIDFEQSLQLPDGMRTFWVTQFPIMDNHDKPCAIASISIDISDRKRAELDLAYNYDLREAIYNESTDAIFLVDPFSMLIFDCNRRAVDMFEADSKQELIGIEGQTLQKNKFTEAEIKSIDNDIEKFGYWIQETEYITKKGHHIWGNLAAKPITVAGKEMNLVRVTDISDRKYAELALQKSEARFQKIATISPEAIYILVRHLDGSMLFEYASPASEELLGVSIEYLSQNPDLRHELFHPDDLAGYEQAMGESLKTMLMFQHEWRIITPQGQIKWIKSQAMPERRANGDIAWYGFAIDISDRKQSEIALAYVEADLKKANQELQRLVNLDGLTQIANRRCFDERVLYEWQRLHREKQPLSLLMFDVDYFKRYNDHYGHQLGDECLLRISQAVDQLVCRPADLVARYGGEEFIVILPNTNLDGAIAVAKIVHEAIADLQIPHQASDVSDVVTISMGIASDIPNLERSPYVLINQADQALYYAKQQGRNQSVIFTD
ncbi:diguanylate cyclase domain-containing protein [Pseudanabaena minima]|uniref:diguanylate cyclase domain-containing protein n=1 Tax=Pseudanabaena minima TaxID=890415 RepID=UPI003DA8F9D4